MSRSGQIKGCRCMSLYQHNAGRRELPRGEVDGETLKPIWITTKWAPQIDLGVPVLIPAVYVPDLDVRLGLYRRLSSLATKVELEGFAAEMIDRFGSLPIEVTNLLETVAIKRLCLSAGVEKVDAGSKGAVIAFRHNEFKNTAGLVEFINTQVGTIKIRPDHKLVFMRKWDDAAARLVGVQYLIKELCKIAA